MYSFHRLDTKERKASQKLIKKNTKNACLYSLEPLAGDGGFIGGGEKKKPFLLQLTTIATIGIITAV